MSDIPVWWKNIVKQSASPGKSGRFCIFFSGNLWTPTKKTFVFVVHLFIFMGWFVHEPNFTRPVASVAIGRCELFEGPSIPELFGKWAASSNIMLFKVGGFIMSADSRFCSAFSSKYTSLTTMNIYTNQVCKKIYDIADDDNNNDVIWCWCSGQFQTTKWIDTLQFCRKLSYFVFLGLYIYIPSGCLT